MEQSPLQTIFLYGVTILRIMKNEAWARRKALKSRQRANFMNLEARTPQQRQFCRKFVISKFPVHGPGCLATYNFLVSQRLAVILAGDLLEARVDWTIYKTFQNTSHLVTKIQVKVRKRPDNTTAFSRAIVLVDDIILRCNDFTVHVGWNVGAPQGIEIAPASELHQFRSLNPSTASVFFFRKFGHFKISGSWTRLFGYV